MLLASLDRHWHSLGSRLPTASPGSSRRPIRGVRMAVHVAPVHTGPVRIALVRRPPLLRPILTLRPRPVLHTSSHVLRSVSTWRISVAARTASGRTWPIGLTRIGSTNRTPRPSVAACPPSPPIPRNGGLLRPAVRPPRLGPAAPALLPLLPLLLCVRVCRDGGDCDSRSKLRAGPPLCGGFVAGPPWGVLSRRAAGFLGRWTAGRGLSSGRPCGGGAALLLCLGSEVYFLVGRQSEGLREEKVC